MQDDERAAADLYRERGATPPDNAGNVAAEEAEESLAGMAGRSRDKRDGARGIHKRPGSRLKPNRRRRLADRRYYSDIPSKRDLRICIKRNCQYESKNGEERERLEQRA